MGGQNEELRTVKSNTTTIHAQRPLQLDTDMLRKEKLDKMSMEIIAEEAMKLFTKTYEALFEGQGKGNNVEDT